MNGMEEKESGREKNRGEAYWRANLRILAVLMPIWLAVAILPGIVLAEPLNRIRAGGFPLGFWFAQQGSILAFVGLILAYALWMGRVDRRHRRPKRRR